MPRLWLLLYLSDLELFDQAVKQHINYNIMHLQVKHDGTLTFQHSAACHAGHRLPQFVQKATKDITVLKSFHFKRAFIISKKINTYNLSTIIYNL